MKSWLAALAMLLGVCVAPAHAHKPSDSYLTLSVKEDTIEGQWDIALRDLDFAVGLDANQDDAITWGEVKAKHADIAAYALSRLRLGAASAPCKKRVTEQLIDDHSDGAYSVLRFVATCAAAPKSLTVDYRLFFDVDPQHRGLLRLDYPGATRAGIFAADKSEQSFTLSQSSRWEQFVDYGYEGVFHIWTGFDHVLFLLSLLLPAVFVLRGGAWSASERFGPVHAVTPERVFELGFEAIQRSDRHKSGIAVRFPRMLRMRKDKKPEEADTLHTLRALLAECEARE